MMKQTQRSSPGLGGGAIVSVFAAMLVFTLSARAADWPTYRADFSRSGQTPESLPGELTEAWQYQAPARIKSAWDEPAIWDGYNKVFDLENRMVFDKALHVAVVGDDCFFGSSVDDKVYCIDSNTGRTRWTFFTDAPIRLAPTIVEDRVYVCSDDGQVYCLARKDGKLIWKQRPAPSARLIPSNGRMVSVWAVRAGLIVTDGKVYCCAGVFPAEGVYLVALNAKDGSVIWRHQIENLPAQGYMLASSSKLYVTTGRDRPIAFDRKTGKELRRVSAGGGGTFALLVGDSLAYGPGKTGEINIIGENSSDRIVSFAGLNMIVTPKVSYLQTATKVTALDRERYLSLTKKMSSLNTLRKKLGEDLKKLKPDSDDAKTTKTRLLDLGKQVDAMDKQRKDCYKWTVDCDLAYSLIRAGDKLFAGGNNRVAAFDINSGKEIWSAKVDGVAYGLAAANGRLFVSTDAGGVYCFAAKAVAKK